MENSLDRLVEDDGVVRLVLDLSLGPLLLLTATSVTARVLSPASPSNIVSSPPIPYLHSKGSDLADFFRRATYPALEPA